MNREILSVVAGGLLGAALILSIRRRQVTTALLATALLVVGIFFT
jgi:ABC-type phosphate/phosphonate transport system permease subunit